jgi:hypothetical protein
VRLARAVAALVVMAAAALSARQAGPQNYKGLEISVAGIARGMVVDLKDCPPGSNTVKGMTRPGEEFASVLVKFTVTPAFKNMMIKKPVLVDTTGKSYNTAVAFIDPASVPEYTCAFHYRVPDGTRLKSLQIDTITLDLAAFDVKKP